jgi:hypothetical protein
MKLPPLLYVPSRNTYTELKWELPCDDVYHGMTAMLYSNNVTLPTDHGVAQAATTSTETKTGKFSHNGNHPLLMIVDPKETDATMASNLLKHHGRIDEPRTPESLRTRYWYISGIDTDSIITRSQWKLINFPTTNQSPPPASLTSAQKAANDLHHTLTMSAIVNTVA